MRSRASLPVIGVVLIAHVAALAAEAPVAVSPGDVSKLAIVDSRCPTFSWGAMPEAKTYELLVYYLRDDREEAEPVLHQTIPGTANGWTPSLDLCLDRGGQYAWVVRSVGEEKESDWSPPNLFEVAAGPSEAEFEEAVAVVRQYLAEETTGSVGALAASGLQRSGSSRSAFQVSDAPAPLTPVAGDSALQVNNSAVVTVATLAGALCSETVLPSESLRIRFLDQGDGTVLDCNTGKLWLKDASCLGTGPWGASRTAGTVQNKVAALNSGTDFSCGDYTPGTHTDWEVPAMTDLCGLWVAFCTGANCCTASMGIVDSSFLDPTVANAAGNGQWMEEDAFVGVQSSVYWSANEGGSTHAVEVNLSSGFITIDEKFSTNYVWPVRDSQ